MKSTKNKGFTLIELLVVIAIIGILSGIAIFGLSDARQKGQDAAIKAALGQIPAQAAIYFDDNNGFGTSATCSGAVFASTNVSGAIADAEETAGESAVCHAAGDTFAVSIGLVSTSTNHCIDSAGFNGTGTAQASGTCS